jgi:para-aminobenzoate synthetase/4-amino-4-deoxychorismate lyase
MAIVPDARHGVFETLLVIDGRPIELDAHLERLTASLEELFPTRPAPDLSRIDVPWEMNPYGPLSDGTSADERNGGDALCSMRVTVAPRGSEELEVLCAFRKIDRDLISDPGPVALRSHLVPGGLGPHKWVDRSLLDEAQAGLPPNTLPLIVDADGTALEASRANVFAVQNGALFTPPLDGRILPGVTRRRLLETAASIGLDTHEAELSRADLLAADEVLLTGSIRGVERVVSLDGAAIDGSGETTASLAAELRRSWAAVQVG